MNEGINEGEAIMILNALPNIGSITVKKLLKNFSYDTLKIFHASFDELCAINGIGSVTASTINNHTRFFDLKKEKEKLNALRGSFIGFDNPTYPLLLREIYDFPIGLYCIGEVSPNNLKNIAIIGSRNATLYGMGIARKLAYDLANKGFCIVSGMAKGIDACAHEGALAAHGKTIAVLGNGIDIIYPAENTGLYRKIAERGTIFSEFTIGRRADRQTFPIRNRLISGLCHAVIVVESDENGGSMITAKFAADHGRQVFAVPGRIDSRASIGCHKLIREGATLLTSSDDICNELLYLSSQTEMPLLQTNDLPIKQTKPEPSLNPIEKTIYTTLNHLKTASIEDLAIHCNLPSQVIMSTLLLLEIKQIVTKRSDGRYEFK